MVNQVPALSIGFGQVGTASASSVLTQAY
jgi:hypothetical protein